MDMMLLPRRNLVARHATVGQNGAASAVEVERTRKGRQRRRGARKLRTGKHPSRYMRLKILKRECQVHILLFLIGSCNYTLYPKVKFKVDKYGIFHCRSEQREVI